MVRVMLGRGYVMQCRFKYVLIVLHANEHGVLQAYRPTGLAKCRRHVCAVHPHLPCDWHWHN